MVRRGFRLIRCKKCPNWVPQAQYRKNRGLCADCIVLAWEKIALMEDPDI